MSDLSGKIEQVDFWNDKEQATKVIDELNDFASVVKKVNENAKTQMQALGFVETRIDHISSITQKNQEVSQECASISEDLAGKAVDLTGMIEKFKK